jgi:hypothetical protein
MFLVVFAAERGLVATINDGNPGRATDMNNLLVRNLLVESAGTYAGADNTERSIQIGGSCVVSIIFIYYFFVVVCDEIDKCFTFCRSRTHARMHARTGPMDNVQFDRVEVRQPNTEYCFWIYNQKGRTASPPPFFFKKKIIIYYIYIFFELIDRCLRTRIVRHRFDERLRGTIDRHRQHAVHGTDGELGRSWHVDRDDVRAKVLVCQQLRARRIVVHQVQHAGRRRRLVMSVQRTVCEWRRRRHRCACRRDRRLHQWRVVNVSHHHCYSHCLSFGRHRCDDSHRLGGVANDADDCERRRYDDCDDIDESRDDADNDDSAVGDVEHLQCVDARHDSDVVPRRRHTFALAHDARLTTLKNENSILFTVVCTRRGSLYSRVCCSYRNLKYKNVTHQYRHEKHNDFVVFDSIRRAHGILSMFRFQFQAGD